MAEREPTTRDMNMAMLLEQLEADPKTRGRLHEIVAEVRPEEAAAFLPDVAVRKAVEPVLERLTKKEAELDARLRTDQQQKNREKLHAALIAEGARPDEILELEAYMVKHDTLSPKLAVMGYRKEHEVAAPAPRVGGGWGVMLPSDKRSGEEFQGINGGPSIGDDWRTWRRDMTSKIIAEDAAAAGGRR